MDIRAAFELDKERIEKGARIELAPGVAIGVARMNNPTYAAELLKFFRKNRFAMERNLIESNEADEQLCGILARTLFVWMEGFTHEGEPLKDTEENRKWALTTFPALREKVVEESQNISNFRALELADEGKDSPTDSDGS